MVHTVAVMAYNGLRDYEYAIVAEVFGLPRPSIESLDYKLVTCRVEPGPLLTRNGLGINPDGNLKDLVSANTVIVPAWRDISERPPQTLIDALVAAHSAGARVVGICTGAFVLAHAGLLDDEIVTTHWLYAEEFRREFPAIKLDPQPLYILGDNNTATSAGSSAGLDLCLALIEADHTSSEATAVARRMVVTHHRPGTQAQFADPPSIAFDQPLGDLLAWIEANLDCTLTVDLLADQAHLSRRTLIRRFKRATGTSPFAWITERRVQQARRLLETTRSTVQAIAVATGLGSPTNLRNHLVKTTGLTPTQYRRTHRQKA